MLTVNKNTSLHSTFQNVLQATETAVSRADTPALKTAVSSVLDTEQYKPWDAETGITEVTDMLLMSPPATVFVVEGELLYGMLLTAMVTFDD
jgi:hypothetical protein